MNELTLLMNEYRLCLRAIWNTFLAAKGGFDERDYFYNASIELFKAIVLFSLEEDRNIEILPAYRGDKKSFMPIRVIALNPEGVLVSKSGEFHDTQSLDSDIQLNKIDSRYIDLYDFNELFFREF